MYLSKARRQADKIEYYYKYAGNTGYSQARYHMDELISLVFKATASKKYKGEAPVIHGIMKEMQQKMDEMKERAEVSNNK